MKKRFLILASIATMFVGGAQAEVKTVTDELGQLTFTYDDESDITVTVAGEESEGLDNGVSFTYDWEGYSVSIKSTQVNSVSNRKRRINLTLTNVGGVSNVNIASWTQTPSSTQSKKTFSIDDYESFVEDDGSTYTVIPGNDLNKYNEACAVGVGAPKSGTATNFYIIVKGSSINTTKYPNDVDDYPINADLYYIAHATKSGKAVSYEYLPILYLDYENKVSLKYENCSDIYLPSSVTTGIFAGVEAFNLSGYATQSFSTTEEGKFLYNSNKSTLYATAALEDGSSFSLPTTTTSISEGALAGNTNITLIPNNETLKGSISTYTSAYLGGTNNKLAQPVSDGTFIYTDDTKTAIVGVETKTLIGGMVTLPASVTSIEAGAFSGWTSCTILYGNNVFTNVSGLGNNTLVKLAQSGKFLYNSTNGCAYTTTEALTGYVKLPAVITSINQDALSKCSNLTVLVASDFETEGLPTLGGTNNKVEKYYMKDEIIYNSTATTLIMTNSSVQDTEIELPNSVTTIVAGALKNCTNVVLKTKQSSITGAETLGGTNNSIAYVATTMIQTATADGKGLKVTGLVNSETISNLNATGKSYVDFREANIESDITVSTAENQIFYFPATSFDVNEGGANNVVINKVCENFVMSDNADLYIPVAFKANKVTVNRTFTEGKYATLVLPFDLSDKCSGMLNYIKPSLLSSWESNKLNFHYSEQAVANMPMLVKAKETTTALYSDNGEVIDIKTTDNCYSKKNNAIIYGTYSTKTTWGTDEYFFDAAAALKRGSTENGNKVKPLRAWISLPGIGESSSAKCVFFDEFGNEEIVEENEATAVSEANADAQVVETQYFSLDGKKLDETAKGTVVVKTIYSDGTSTSVKINK